MCSAREHLVLPQPAFHHVREKILWETSEFVLKVGKNLDMRAVNND
jgi:hypothetical protein